jgi:hypothetical protein
MRQKMVKRTDLSSKAGSKPDLFKMHAGLYEAIAP